MMMDDVRTVFAPALRASATQLVSQCVQGQTLGRKNV
jgi:hypothetical protein